MIGAVYVEQAVAEHPRARAILKRLSKLPHVPIESYGEVFNRKGQNFRLQKKRPSLILAHKYDGWVLPTPEGYGVGGERNFYFSHLLNCPYDCRYCFLQGMYNSAHFVLFVNYESFFDRALVLAAETPEEPVWFFSGYDADSLALDGLTGFVAAAVKACDSSDNAWLELRTKTATVSPLLALEAPERAVVAWSFTPEELSERYEHGVPSVQRRLAAAAKLAERGWRIGLRFDPLLLCDDFEATYAQLFAQVFAAIPRSAVHSVSLGPFRLPNGFMNKLIKLYPDSELVLSGPFEAKAGMTSYRRDLERRMISSCREMLLEHVDEELFFPCPLPE